MATREARVTAQSSKSDGGGGDAAAAPKKKTQFEKMQACVQYPRSTAGRILFWTELFISCAAVTEFFSLLVKVGWVGDGEVAGLSCIAWTWTGFGLAVFMVLLALLSLFLTLATGYRNKAKKAKYVLDDDYGGMEKVLKLVKAVLTLVVLVIITTVSSTCGKKK